MNEKTYWTLKWISAFVGVTVGILLGLDIVNPIQGIGIPLFGMFLVSTLILGW